MQVSAKLNNLRISSRKSSLVANLIKGLDAEDALSQLEITLKGSSSHFKKLLQSAIANGRNNFGIDPDNMYVLDVIVGAGPSLKRWMPKAYGRAGRILKRTSNITLIIEERVEGKGRKTKEQMEKERKERADEKRKMEQARVKEKEEEKEKIKKPDKDISHGPLEAKVEKIKKEETKRSWASRIFRRKSM